MDDEAEVPRTWREVGTYTPTSTKPPSVLIGVAVGVLVAGVLVWTGHAPAAVVLVVIVSALTVGRLVSPAFDRVLARVLARVGHLVGLVLSWITLGLTMLVVIAPVWLISKVSRWNVLEPGTDGGRWAARRTRPWRSRPDRGFADDRRDLTGRTRLHGALTVLVPVVLVVALVPALRGEVIDVADRVIPGSLQSDGDADAPEVAAVAVGPSAPITDGIPEPTGDFPDGYPRDALLAHRDDPWINDYLEQYFPVAFGFDPYLTVRQADRSEQYVNVRDRVRRSYVPAGADTDPAALDVWFFGGSALFGQGQRDDYTIPSEIARLAERDGVVIRAYNFGVSGYWTWQDSLLLAQMLSERAAPDVIVAYEGYNDVVNTLGPSGAMQVNAGFADVVRDLLIETGSDYDGAAFDTTDYMPRTTVRSPQNSATIYARGAQLARDIAAAHDIPIMQFLQPAVWSRDLAVDDASLANIGADREYHDTYAPGWNQTRALMAVDGVIDLGDALDGMDQLIYTDDVHTNEEAARVVAEAMYDHLGPTLASLYRGG